MMDEEPQCLGCELGQHTIYSPTVEADAATFASHRREVLRLKAGQHVLRAGETPTRVYTIRSGWAFRYILLADGRRHILSFLLPGDTICLECVCRDNQPIAFSVRALTNLVLCAFDIDAMEQVVFGTEEQRARFRGAMRDHLARMDRRAGDLGRRHAIGRLAQLIIEIQGKLITRKLAEGEGFECAIRREHLADALGMTVAHVNRTIAQLERMNVLAIAQRHMRVLNRDALLRIADEE